MIKAPKEIERHREFYKTCAEHGVKNVPSTTFSETSYEYQFIPGRMPAFPSELKHVSKILGRPYPNNMSLDVEGYIRYIRERAIGLPWGKHCESALRLHSYDQKWLPHGDLTRENMVWNGRLFLIDPGELRGLPCRELDEAKMLQSTLTQWEYLKGHEPWKHDIPFKLTRVNLALLASHWIRLSKHYPTAWELVYKIVDTIEWMLFNETTSIGLRRSGLELQVYCSSSLQGCLPSCRPDTDRRGV